MTAFRRHLLNRNMIVLTGGPGGGKSTLMAELRQDDPRADRWILVPEAAPLLFRARLDGRQRASQRAVVRLQIALKSACAEAPRPGQVLLCHRGTLDPLAYWLPNGGDGSEFFGLIAMMPGEHLERSAAVIHLQTATIGAEAFYCRCPDPQRPETLEEAPETDRSRHEAWRDHHRYALITKAGLSTTNANLWIKG